MTGALAGQDIDLRGLGPEEIQMMLSGGQSIGKMKADQVMAQQAADIAGKKDVIANAKLALDEKKANIQQELAEKRITAQEARDRENQADRDAQIAVSQGMLAVAMRNADVASRRADIADKATRDANAPKPLTPAQQLDMDTQIAGISAAIASGKDSKGNDLDPASLDSYVALYNKHSPNDKYVKAPDTPPKTIGGREIPFTGEKGGYVKVPKTGVAPAGAVDLLKKNPALKDQFKKKYGYLPEGI